MTIKENIMKLQTYKIFEGEDTLYVERDDVLKLLEQEPCEKVAQERYADLCEYFGGAKDILKNRKDFKAWLERVKWHIHKAEELYEKYEYKKELCEDAISREDIEQFKELMTDINGDVIYAVRMSDIRQLPPVKPQEPNTKQFAKWVASEIFDIMWEYNQDAFAEIACRKLAKLGIVRAKGDEWELVEEQEGAKNEHI